MGGLISSVVGAALVSMPCYLMEKGELFQAMEDHKEYPVASGAVGADKGDVGAVVVFTSKDGDAFSIALIFPNGSACLAFVGIGWSTWTPADEQPETREH